MSVTTVIGFLVGIALFLGAILISTDNVMMFLSASSLIMVLGGTLANAFISFQGPYVLQALKNAASIFAHAQTNETVLVTTGTCALAKEQEEELTRYARLLLANASCVLNVTYT